MNLIFTRRILPTRPHSRHEKNFGRDASAGQVERLWTRKTRESVSTDSRRRHHGPARCAAARFGRNSVPILSREEARAMTARLKIPPRISQIRFFNSSLTVCGLALPLDAFITWPTNQPIAFGLVLASATLSGFLATMSSTIFSTRHVSTYFSALFDSSSSAGRCTSFRGRSEQILGQHCSQSTPCHKALLHPHL